jgi:transposase
MRLGVTRLSQLVRSPVLAEVLDTYQRDTASGGLSSRSMAMMATWQIEQTFRRHHSSTVIESMPCMGPRLGAEFLAATGGDVTSFGTADRLAAVAGLAPAPKDSGRVSGNLRRPRRYDRLLLRVAYLSAQLSIRSCPASKTFYDRKRAEGKRHTQAILALARRRSNVLWAMLRDGTIYDDRSGA